ncbi:MAG: hypothetical protein JRN20_15510 [Nitrososphaerota archaeon]|nr:hypothetical protein [Nitrososphaerota archaeon]
MSSAPSSSSWHKVVTDNLVIIALLLAAPLIVSFVIFLMASSLGAACLPSVGYGVQSIPSSSISNPTSGISYIWIMAKSASYPFLCTPVATDMTFPTAVLSILNTLLSLAVLVGAFIVAYKMVGELPHASNR